MMAAMLLGTGVTQTGAQASGLPGLALPAAAAGPATTITMSPATVTVVEGTPAL